VNWKHVKHFLLLLLVGVNLLLGYFVYTHFSETHFTDTLTAARTAEILQKDGITVSESLLAAKNDTADALSAPYTRENYLLSVATLLLGKEPDGVYLLPDGIRAETLSGESVLLGNDLSIDYCAQNGGATAKAEESMNRVLPYTEEEKKEAIAAFATLLSLPEDELKDAAFTKGDGCYLLYLQQAERGIPLSGFVCTFGIADGKLVYAEGRHFFGIPDEKAEAPLLNRVNILLSERDRGVQGKVTDIALCYALYEEAENEMLHFLPAYRIQYASGNVSVVGAIDGNPIE